MKLISIIIPTYEREEILEETLNSILDQNYDEWEAIIVDDNKDSYQESVKDIVKAFDEKSENSFRYVLNTDGQGPASARNLGISEAEGDYVAFLDDDDLWKPSKLEKQIKSLEDYGFEASHTSRQMDTSSDHPEHVVEAVDVTDIGQVLSGNPIATSSVLVEKSYLEEVDDFDEERDGGEDWHLWAKLADHGCRFKAVKEPLTVINMEIGSFSSKSETSTPGKDKLTEEFRDELESDNRIASQYYLSRGKEHLKFKNFDKSEEMLRKALKHDKANHQAYIFLLSGKIERTTGLNMVDPLVKIKHMF